MSFLDQLSDGETSGGGTGIFAKVKLVACIKTFCPGLGKELNTLEYDASLDGAKEAAIETIKTRIVEAGYDPSDPQKRPQVCVGLEVAATDAYPKPWKSGMMVVVPKWTANWKGVQGDETKPGLKAVLEKFAKEGFIDSFGKAYFMHLAVVPDYTGRISKDDNPRPETFWLPIAVYKTHDEMIAAAQAVGLGVGESVKTNIPTGPEGWPPAVWNEYYPKIKAALDEGNFAKPVLTSVADEYGLTPEFLATLK